MEPIPVVRLEPPAVRVLDQTLLPAEERWLELRTVEGLEEAIRSLRVRGAPLLGLCGAIGVAIAAGVDASDARIQAAAERIGRVRPTAVELESGARACAEAVRGLPREERAGAAWRFCGAYLARRQGADGKLAEHGLSVVRPGAVLTHCNTGSLATGGLGTALGVIRLAFERGMVERCYVTETRPLLQGARLTMWELERSGIPAVLLPDTAAAALLASGAVSTVITGADRVARNGDTANKVGTLQLALAAARFGVPFVIAAPRSTFDPACPAGSAIPIEQRDASEVGGWGALQWTVPGAAAFNPAFDVTPADLITAFVTEHGVIRQPFTATIPAFLAATPEGVTV